MDIIILHWQRKYKWMHDNKTAYFCNKVATWFENMCGDIESLWKQKTLHEVQQDQSRSHIVKKKNSNMKLYLLLVFARYQNVSSHFQYQ